jgi:hypothetical protein
MLPLLLSQSMLSQNDFEINPASPGVHTVHPTVKFGEASCSWFIVDIQLTTTDGKVSYSGLIYISGFVRGFLSSGI